jgi:DNA-binding MarR family transcriptional regulator
MEFHEQYPDKTGIYVNDLAEQLEVSKSMVSKMLQNLEQRDLIERAVDPHNRRNTFVFLTQKGRAFDDLQRRRADAFVYQVSDRLGEERFLEIMDGIRALTGAMLEELDSVPDET